jgi:Glycolipid transfer protein (GLTP)
MNHQVAAILTSAIALIGVRSKVFAQGDLIEQTCPNDASPILPSTSFGFCFASTACLLLFVLFFGKEGNVRSFLPSLSFTRSATSGNVSYSGGYRALSGLSRATSVDALKNLSKNLLHSLDSCSLKAAIQAITRKECFARSDYVERLSSNDVALLYRYASNVNVAGFDKAKFLADQSQIVKAVITAMDMAVKVSRGCLKEPTKLVERTEGDVDALYFVAATRIFAEWRTLRLVPKGYQRYAVGLSLAYRDVLQNLEKIERGVHEYLRYHQVEQPQMEVPSPTLRKLLQFELDTNVHKRLPKLEEKSSASGVLWTKRQLHYQVATLSNSLEVPECYPTAKEAANAAYRTVYDEYHGWAVKKIFSHSFGGSPPLDTLWLSLDPPKDMPENGKVTKKNKSRESHSFQEMPGRTMSDVSDASEQRKREEDNEFLMALDSFNRHIVEKWEDMLRMFNCGREEKKKKDNLVLSSDSHFNLNALSQSTTTKSAKIESELAMKESPNKAARGNDNPIERSKRSAEDFVREVSPMIADLGEMIEKLNMNDPSRV